MEKIFGLEEQVEQVNDNKKNVNNDYSNTSEIINNVLKGFNNNHALVQDIVLLSSFINDDWSQPIAVETYESVIGFNPFTGDNIQLEFSSYIEIDIVLFGKRIPYHIIASIIYEMERKKMFSNRFDDQRERIQYNLEVLKDKFEINNVALIMLDKIASHCELSFIQSMFISDSVKNVTEQANKTKETLNEIKATKGQIYTEFVGILGIFSALIFGLFGGFQGVTSILTVIADSSINNFGKIIMIASVIMTAIITLIYFMIKWIGILMDKPVKSCKCKQTESCNHSFYEINSSYINAIYIIGIFFIFGFFIEILNFFNVSSYISDNGLVIFIIILVIVLIMLRILFLVFSSLTGRKINTIFNFFKK